MKLISILMSVYNESLNYVQKSVNSILAQTYSKIELIIIIDDPTNRPVINYLYGVKNKFDNVKICINEKNRGLIYSLNEGIKLCEGYYVARMDADDISLFSRLKEEVNFLEHNEYDIVGSNYYKINSMDTIIDKTNYAGNNFQVKKRLQKINCVGHPTWLLKKTVYEELNGYRNIYSCEDYDFLLRASLRGYKIGVFETPLLKYRINENGISQQNSIRQKIISNLLAKNYKRNEILDLDWLNEYLNSDKYKRKVNKEKKLFKLKKNIKKYIKINNLN